MNKTEESALNRLKSIVHILNGDALQELLSVHYSNLEGSFIILRECMMEGPVLPLDFKTLIPKREAFLQQQFPQVGNGFYKQEVFPELNKIENLSAPTEVHLWFEDDLFCQLNFWYALHVLKDSSCTCYLVRPKAHAAYSFAAHSAEELKDIFVHKEYLSPEHQWHELWEFYANGNLERLVEKAKQLEEKYPFILAAVQAHIARMPDKDSLGRPKETLLELSREMKTKEFIPLFKEFSRREAIYGFGDLQVKKMHEELF